MTDCRHPVVTERAQHNRCIVGIQAWSGLGSVRDNYRKNPYTIFCVAFEYPGQPHEVAIWGSEFPGTHHFHRVGHRERGTKSTCSGTANCTLSQPQNGSSWIELLWILTSEACHTGMDGTFSSVVTEESCSGSCESLPSDKDHQLHGAADLFFSELCYELLFYSLNQISFILSPALT